MRKNVGTADRIIRVVVGLALLGLFALPIGNARWFGVLAVVPLATAAVGFCPLYTLFGIRTCRTN